jgi:hypothetical protein
VRPVELEAPAPPTRGLDYVLPDGGAGLRRFAAERGCELALVASSATSCTVRAKRGRLDSHPLVVTFTAEDVQRAELDEEPEWLGDPQRFLAASATRDAAVWHLSDVVLDFEHERLLEPLDVRPLALNATPPEYLDHPNESTEAVKAYRQRRTLSGALRRRVHRLRRRPIWSLRETDTARNPGLSRRRRHGRRDSP